MTTSTLVLIGLPFRLVRQLRSILPLHAKERAGQVNGAGLAVLHVIRIECPAVDGQQPVRRDLYDAVVVSAVAPAGRVASAYPNRRGPRRAFVEAEGQPIVGGLVQADRAARSKDEQHLPIGHDQEVRLAKSLRIERAVAR